MSVTTYAEIHVGKAFAELADILILTTGEEIIRQETDDTITYTDESAINGEIRWLEALFEQHFVPYDKFWNAGAQLGSGAKHVRLRNCDDFPGLATVIKSYNDNDGFVAGEWIVALFNQDGIQAVLDCARTAIDSVAPLSPRLREIKPSQFHETCLLDTQKAVAKGYGREANESGLEETPGLCARYRALIQHLPHGALSEAITAAWLEGWNEESKT